MSSEAPAWVERIVAARPLLGRALRTPFAARQVLRAWELADRVGRGRGWVLERLGGVPRSDFERLLDTVGKLEAQVTDLQGSRARAASAPTTTA